VSWKSRAADGLASAPASIAEYIQSFYETQKRYSTPDYVSTFEYEPKHQMEQQAA